MKPISGEDQCQESPSFRTASIWGLINCFRAKIDKIMESLIAALMARDSFLSAAVGLSYEFEANTFLEP